MRPARIVPATLLCGAALSLVTLIAPGTAAAVAPESQITSPSGTIYPLQDSSTDGSEITVAGTANFSEATIRCYYQAAGSGYRTLVAKTTVKEGSFSAAFTRGQLSDVALCRLRAVPVTETNPNPPAAEGPFKGPLVVQSFFESGPHGYFAASQALAGTFLFETAESCGEESSLYGAVTLERSDDFFYCLNEILDRPEAQRELKVDGDYGYTPGAAQSLYAGTLKGKVKDVPEESVGTSLNEADGQMTITEEDPIVKCSPEPAEPASEAGCTEFVPSGVTLKRTWQTADAGHLATLRDAWVSADGKAHSLEYHYYTEFAGAGGSAEGDYEFPGANGFSATQTGKPIAVPAGPGTILYRRDAESPETGEEIQPQGAVVYDRTPGTPIPIPYGSSEDGDESAFELPYSLSVPAGGEAAVRLAFIQSFSLPEVKSLAASTVAAFKPTITIGAPATGSSTSSPSASVSGTVGDSGAIASVTVNGQAATVTGSTWSATVPLTPGANAITATATDDAGLTATAGETVTYTVAEKPAPPKASKLSAPKTNGEKVTVALACTGPTGTSCKVQLSLATVEHLSHGKLKSLSASTRKLILATVTVTIAAGGHETVTIKLGATGRKLLARFHKLPVQLTVMALGAPNTTVVAQALTLKQPPKKHKR